MLRWALFFFIVSIVAAAFGFTGIAAAAGGIARILFFIVVVLFLVFLVLGSWLERPYFRAQQKTGSRSRFYQSLHESLVCFS